MADTTVSMDPSVATPSTTSATPSSCITKGAGVGLALAMFLVGAITGALVVWLIFRAKIKKLGGLPPQSEKNNKNAPRNMENVERGGALSDVTGDYLSTSKKPLDGSGSTFPSYGYDTNGDSGANEKVPSSPPYDSNSYGIQRDNSSGDPNLKDDNQPMSPDTSTPKDNYGTSPTSDDAPGKSDDNDGDNSAVDNNDNNDNDDKAEENKQGPTGKKTRIALLQEAQRVQSSAAFPKNDVVSKGDIKNEDDSAKSDNDNSDVSDNEDDASTPAPAPAPVPAPKKVTKLPPPKIIKSTSSKPPKQSTAAKKTKSTKPAGKPSTREVPLKKAAKPKKPSIDSAYDSGD